MFRCKIGKLKSRNILEDIFYNAVINLNSPPILFFILGFIATILKSDLKIPESIAKALSIYFMMAIGFKGGVEIMRSGWNDSLLSAAGLTLVLGSILPIIAFYILKGFLKLDIINSGAIAAHYGSVSVVTFVTATVFLGRNAIEFPGFMVGMMALMESPAIFMSLLLVSLNLNKDSNGSRIEMKEVVKESLFNASVLLLFGSLVIGYLTGEKGAELTHAFFYDPFQGILTIFLLEMGMLAGTRIGEFKRVGIKLALFAIVMPLISGAFGAVGATLIGLNIGSATLFAVLSASASYIAAPAAIRIALPKANPAYYITMSLAITFPFNIIFGIPLFYSLSEFLSRYL
jgi:uncharacterized protein